MNERKTMAQLRGFLKTHGRCRFLDDGAMTADWSASGFSVRVRTDGEDFTVCTRSAEAVYLSLWVDGKEALRPLIAEGEGSVTVTLGAGEHTVSVFRDSQIGKEKGLDLTGVIFGGEYLPRPENRRPYIEFIGDSISCGDGALGVYRAGEKWVLSDHSATHGFPFFVADAAEADRSIVAIGGIGAVHQVGNFNMEQLYPYENRYRFGTEPYDFKRVPDLVVLELGANDGRYTNEEYYGAITRTIALIRKYNGANVPIVWFGRYERFEKLIRDYQEITGDPHFYAFRFHYGGSGSAALTTQTEGHPSAAEQKEAADALLAYLREQKLL